MRFDLPANVHSIIISNILFLLKNVFEGIT